ncbi:MAG TPA: DUF2252 family protein [Chitinophagaceae bacterium]|jgi:uncharacterized protein (DUF2252 family)|nr:DUF2252 family protein [Chitinophagaceae bacterium]
MNNVEERIKQFNHSYSEDSLKIKYQRMSENAFSFFRGTCHLFYEDLAKENNLAHSPQVWICGDLHLENFGSYKADNRLVYFDLNDFNEAVLAPSAWELLRMTTSIFIGLDSLKVEQKQIKKLAELFLHSYSSVLSKGKARYLEPQVVKGTVRKFLKKVSKRKEKELLEDRTYRKNESLRLRIDNERLFSVDKNLKDELFNHIAGWISENGNHYNCNDLAFRIAGTGSIGVKRYLFLLQHVNKTKNYLFLDMKEALPSCVQPYMPIQQPAWLSEAERMVIVQNYMQNNSPAFLSFSNFNNLSFVIKELQPSEDKIKFSEIGKSRKEVREVIADMALLTASAQLRSSGRKGATIADELISFGASGHWQNSILDMSWEYYNRMKSYYAEFFKKHNGGLF